jgi:hypothetical protein
MVVNISDGSVTLEVEVVPDDEVHAVIAREWQFTPLMGLDNVDIGGCDVQKGLSFRVLGIEASSPPLSRLP